MSGGTMVSLIGGVASALLFVLVIAAVAGYRRLVRLRGQADAAWSQVDAQLARRYQVAPRLVRTVQRWAAYEWHTAEEVAVAQGTAMAATTHAAGPAGRAVAEGRLSEAIGRLLTAGEAYPALRANPDFSTLQLELTTIEDRIGYARRSFNDTVGAYNTAVRRMPGRLVAAVAGFRSRDPFQAIEPRPEPVRVTR